DARRLVKHLRTFPLSPRERVGVGGEPAGSIGVNSVTVPGPRSGAFHIATSRHTIHDNPRFLSQIEPGMIGNLLQPELVELIRQRNFAQLREILSEFSAPDIAEIFTDLSPDDEAVLMRILPHDVAAEVFEYLSVDDQEKMLHALGNEQVAQILNDLPPDDRTALLEELPAAATQKLLNLLSPAERKIAADLLGYPEDSIGRRMTPEYVAIKQGWNVGEVLNYLRTKGRKPESL